MVLRALAFVVTAVVTVALSLAFLTYSASRIDPANAYFQPTNIYRSGLQGTGTLALTFDDGPSAFTGALLDSLARNNVKATFFVVGARVRHHSDVLERMMREGHVIANHSFNHSRLGRRYANNPELLHTQIGRTNEAIAPFIRPGQGLYFRAPYGIWRRAHAEFLNADPVLKHYVGPVYWDIGGQVAVDDEGTVRAAADWDCWSKDFTAEQCGDGYLREIKRKGGGIVLMHDIRERSLWMVDYVLPKLTAAGYKFVTLDEVPRFDQYKTPVTEDVPVASDEGRLPFASPAR
ncbi:MAG: polysaccharide deacetylase family protein [Alphaproteobacteria bacterium]|nr:polysaccharide deacetylase family protein [Alphaproteobacteria bacterium]